MSWMASDVTLRMAPANRYDHVAMTLHWLIALIMVPMLFFGGDLVHRQTDTFLPSVHASAGSPSLFFRSCASVGVSIISRRLCHRTCGHGKRLDQSFLPGCSMS